MTEDAAIIRAEVEQIVARLGCTRGKLLPILQEVQQALGYLPAAAMQEVGRLLSIPAMDVYSVATFYNQFRLTPPGKHCVKVCMGTACHMNGGGVVLDAWKRRLGIEPGQTTADREFQLDTVACVGACSMAPISIVDDQMEPKIGPTRVDGILLSLEMQREASRTEQEDDAEGADRKEGES